MPYLTYRSLREAIWKKNMRPKCPKCSGFSIINYFHIPEADSYGVGRIKKIFIGSLNVPKNKAEIHFHNLRVTNNLDKYPNIKNYSRQIQSSSDGIFECERCKHITDDVLGLFIDMS